MNKKIIFLIITIILIIGFYLGIKNIAAYRIEGHSMNPTLYEYEVVIGIRTNKIERGDIIAFQKKDQHLAIKRVIGLPGETINILEDGTVIINGNLVDEPYLDSKEIKRVELEFPFQIPEGEYFVLGDNRIDSLDSKNFQIGTIKKSEIEAKIIFRINPFKKF